MSFQKRRISAEARFNWPNSDSLGILESELFMPCAVDLDVAKRIAEEYVGQLKTNGEFQLILLRAKTIEHDFGWVFFWGSSDPSIVLAGNAPFIVDRKDGSIHVTGTAYPIEEYVESYARVGRAYPFAVPEHLVIIAGWKPGMLKISLTKTIRSGTGKGLAEAKHCVEEVIAGRNVVLTFPNATNADRFSADAQQLGALVKRETRYQLTPSCVCVVRSTVAKWG